MSEKTYAERIFSFATQLQSTINNLQDFYDLKNGQIVLKSDPFDLHQWIEHIIYFFAPQASAKELSIAYIIDAQVPKKVVGDALRLHQILYNLLDNALKFTHQGQITLFVDHISPDNKDECELYFAVQDTGIGILPQDIDYLFTISRNMTSIPANYQSKGLGLLINKELVELMGGQIGVESNTGAGSTFYFTVTL